MYTTVAAVKAEFPKLKTWGEGSAPTDPQITAMIEQADARIDGYCAGRYATPLDPVPDTVEEISRYLVAARIMERLWPDTPEAAQAKLKQATSLLADIATGKLKLVAQGVGESATEAGADAGPLYALPTGDPTFSMEDDW